MVGNISLEDLIIYDEDWYEERGIELHLNCRVVKVEPKKNVIHVERENGQEPEIVKYDVLVIASGSKPVIPKSVVEDERARKKYLVPIHRNKKGWHVLRTIEDADGIREHLKQAQRITIIGSGLLGLEIANKFRSDDLAMDTSIIEIEDSVAPVYLDKQGSLVLLNLLERAGVKVLVNTEVTECIGGKYIEGCRLSDKTIHKGDMVIFACGIVPNTDFLIDSGIELIEFMEPVPGGEEVENPDITRTILVNEYMQTNFDNVYAVGDCCEFKGYLYGINPAAIEQGKICAYNIVKPDGNTKKYEGTVLSVSFNGFDTRMVSLGRVNEYTIEPDILNEVTSYYKVDLTLGEYKKILIHKDRVIGAILIGDVSLQMDLKRMITERIDVSGFKDLILRDGFELRDFI